MNTHTNRACIMQQSQAAVSLYNKLLPKTKYFTERQTSSGRVALSVHCVCQPVSEPHSTLGWTSRIDC